MNHLLYSSNEMFSSTDLIRKSKIIFDKINTREIDKAIILRDGKPNFMLLNFALYEKIMAEYDVLKKIHVTDETSNKRTNKQIIKQIDNIVPVEKKYIPANIESNLNKFNEIINVKNLELKVNNNIIIDPIIQSEDIDEDIELKTNIVDEVIIESDEDKEEKIRIKEFKAQEEIELKKALEQLEALNLDPVLKEEAKEQIKIKKNAELKDFWN